MCSTRGCEGSATSDRPTRCGGDGSIGTKEAHKGGAHAGDQWHAHVDLSVRDLDKSVRWIEAPAARDQGLDPGPLNPDSRRRGSTKAGRVARAPSNRRFRHPRHRKAHRSGPARATPRASPLTSLMPCRTAVAAGPTSLRGRRRAAVGRSRSRLTPPDASPGRSLSSDGVGLAIDLQGSRRPSVAGALTPFRGRPRVSERYLPEPRSYAAFTGSAVCGTARFSFRAAW
jgi:hypothetical protein